MNAKIIFAGLFLMAATAASVQANSAIAEIKGTAENSPIKGTVTFEDTTAGLRVRAQLANVPPGLHGFHIHEYGSCAEEGKAAGGHYNPAGTQHGMVVKDGVKHAHAGDMGNIKADASGGASLEVLIPGVSIAAGTYTVGGRAVILHEKADDFGQPVGNAGGRIGCGPILLVSAGSK